MADDYAGDLSVRETWDLLERDAEAVLLDVRGAPEWRYVGLPDLRVLGKETLCASWQLYPDMRPNPEFLAEVRAAGLAPGRPVLLICRSGVRSRDAAVVLTGAGYGPCYNVADGFEGPKDEAGHRGGRGGWKAAGLPWTQE